MSGLWYNLRNEIGIKQNEVTIIDKYGNILVIYTLKEVWDYIELKVPYKIKINFKNIHIIYVYTS